MIDEIVDARRLARHADQILLAVALDIARADIGVVAPQCLDNIVESKLRQRAGRQRRSRDMALIAADAVDLGDAGVFLSRAGSPNPEACAGLRV
jgi:hypothetical protein